MTGSLSVSFSFSRYYGDVIKQYRFLQVFIGNMMVLQIFCIKIKHDIFPLYKPLIFCVKMILSILVDTFISKISLPMQPVPEIRSISGA